MKIYIITILLALYGFTTLHAQKTVDVFEIQVDGLGCPFCAYGLEKKFKEFKGIKAVSIKIETGDFRFTYPTEKALSMNAVIAQVKKAGYTPKTAKITRANAKEEIFPTPTLGEAIEENKLDKGDLLVKGNCEMCKYRIEAAAKSTKGVQNAVWDVNTKMLEVSFLDSKTSLEKIAKNIADAGHDSKSSVAENNVYDELPLCCAYRNPNAKTH